MRREQQKAEEDRSAVGRSSSTVEARTGAKPVTRRRVLAAGAAAATVAVSPQLGGATAKALTGLQVESAAESPLAWQPRCLDVHQARLLAQLCELLLPRTATPGAGDAGVPEWIDLAVSLAEPHEQLAFLGGLGWIEQRSQNAFAHPFLDLPEEKQIALLREISDEHAKHPPELEAGAAFFTDLKAKTLFAYFTSKTGRMQTLGLPEKVERETLRGCTHEEDEGHA